MPGPRSQALLHDFEFSDASQAAPPGVLITGQLLAPGQRRVVGHEGHLVDTALAEDDDLPAVPVRVDDDVYDVAELRQRYGLGEPIAIAGCVQREPAVAW